MASIHTAQIEGWNSTQRRPHTAQIAGKLAFSWLGSAAGASRDGAVTLETWVAPHAQGGNWGAVRLSCTLSTSEGARSTG